MRWWGRRLPLVEQPMPREDLDYLKIIASKSPIPVFADESARTLDDIIRIIDVGSCTWNEH